MSQLVELPGFIQMGPCPHAPEDWPIDLRETIPGCQDCGKLLWTYECPQCGQTFLQWGGGEDDVISGAYATSSGDGPFCLSCAQSYEEAELEAEDDSWEADP